MAERDNQKSREGKGENILGGNNRYLWRGVLSHSRRGALLNRVGAVIDALQKRGRKEPWGGRKPFGGRFCEKKRRRYIEPQREGPRAWRGEGGIKETNINRKGGATKKKKNSEL